MQPFLQKAEVGWVAVPGSTDGFAARCEDFGRKAKLLTPLTAGLEMELVCCDSALLLIALRCWRPPLRTTCYVPGDGADLSNNQQLTFAGI